MQPRTQLTLYWVSACPGSQRDFHMLQGLVQFAV
jgi:hypothetical protein